MTRDQHISDEFLNAYLDGELSSSDEAQLLSRLRHDAELSHRLCQLQRVQNMLHLAYHEDGMPRPKEPMLDRHIERRSFIAIAASVLLLIGAVGGWFSNTHLNEPQGLLQLAKDIRTNKPQTGDAWRLMLHVNTGDTYRYNVILDETERLLKTAADKNEKVTIQILTNAAGLKLLEDNQSPQAQRLRKLYTQYDNLLLTACGQTLKRLKAEKNIEPKLLATTKIVPSAIQEVIDKQKQGWTYIRI